MAIRNTSGVRYSSTGWKIKRILDAYPGAQGHLYITSSRRSWTPPSYHTRDNPTAVDIGFGYPSGNTHGGIGLAAWLFRFSGDLTELIHAQGRGFYVKNGRRVGPYAVSIHRNHIHVAMSSAQADRVLGRIGAGGGGGGGGGTGGGSGLPSPITSIRTVRQQQVAANRTSLRPKLELDGEWGPLTFEGVKFAQRRYGVTDDGLWGPATEAGYKRYHSRSRNPEPPDGKLAVDGVLGPNTISEMQRQLNAKLAS